jgi:hypothetical protein
MQGFVRGDLINATVTEFLDKPFDDGPVGSHRIFFSNGSCGNRSRFWRLWKVSWYSSLGKRVKNLGRVPKISL